MMIRLMISTLLLLLGSGLLAADGGDANPSFSEATLDVSQTVTLAGKVDLAALAAEYPQGVLLIDLRTAAEEGVAAESEQAAVQGIRYENLPVAGAQIDAAQVTALETLLSSRQDNEHVVIHCASGNRAGMLWGALQVDSGADVTAVLETLQPILNKEPAQAALLEYATADES
jgi:protein tyrosine phosphatase (PTP) superfamily phosphohydrolase (DUF442 family)